MAGKKRRGAGAGKKDPFESLPSDFKDAVESENVADLDKRVAEIAKDGELNKAAKKADQDLQSKIEEAKVAGLVYAETAKLLGLKLKYITRVLSDRGDAKSTETIRLNFAALAP